LNKSSPLKLNRIYTNMDKIQLLDRIKQMHDIIGEKLLAPHLHTIRQKIPPNIDTLIQVDKLLQKNQNACRMLREVIESIDDDDNDIL
jgi:hypothetical protein